MRLTDDERGRIASAIASAEQRTSGEVFCVVARNASTYADVSLAWAAGAALILPLLLLPLGLDVDWPGRGGWQAAHQAARSATVAQALGVYALIQAAVFVGVFLLTRIPPVLRWATPRGLRRARVRKAALQQFFAHGVHVTRERTGVLLFAALDEHQVELIADEGIHALVQDSVWAEAVGALSTGLRAGRAAEGFEKAIGLCGQVLARHFPPRADNPNELPDHLILL
ncbi:TPM domain-containing protein [Brevundimonas sp. SORGH_AS_0993]|uniref:TPM domain-containing protein n=1 Tax=Brevundimonas sp. SORGH_AS_0993 TaxID=3041794 RepID=UPI00278774DB|nr:TPM domain-containing protein [Brevundimonas sp. SORGH_AS_0993]MDQ1153811.1 putative membrane protein [Brevundimonas sp. SORGH_AS_0993]